jgi:hypothetical protein
MNMVGRNKPGPTGDCAASSTSLQSINLLAGVFPVLKRFRDLRIAIGD